MAVQKLMNDARAKELITEVKTRLATKVDKVSGKQLSTEDFTTELKTKLEGIEAGGEVNVLEGIKVDGTDLTIDANKKITLNKMALKDEIAESDLASALATKINGKADQSTTYTKTDVDGLLDDKADLASPVLTGTPTAPTATAGTNTTQIATTAFVKAACDAISASLAAALKFKGIVANLTELEAIVNPANGDVYQVTNPGIGKTNAEYAYDGTSWVELGTEVDLSGYAPLASPAFTGTPTAPTATKGTDTTQVATTAYVKAELGDYVPSSDITIITEQELAAMWAD